MAKFDIEAYIDGELNQDERAAFEAEMDRNPEFAQEVRLMQQLTGDLQTQLLRDHVTQAIEEGGSGGGGKSTSFWLGGLALLLLFCAAGYFFLFSDNTSSSETPPLQSPPSMEPPQQVPGGQPENPGKQQHLQASENKPPTNRPIAGITRLPDPRYPAPIVRNIRGTGSKDSILQVLLDKIWYMDFPPAGTRFASPFDEVGQLLQSRAFPKASLQLELLKRTKADNDTLRYLMGYCLLEMGQGKSALEYLEPTADDNAAWSEYRQWYQALSLLSSGEKEEAKKMLETIQNTPKHHFQRQSAKALELLK